MATNTIANLAGLQTMEIVDRVVSADFDKATAQLVLASSLLEQIGRVKTRFSYRQPLAAEDTDLVLKFARSFEHADWIDGESVVQAEETPSEEGFNRRFHAIETDIDRLGAEIGRSIAEIAAMRRQLATMFEDIRVALDRLDSKLADDFTAPPVAIDPRDFGLIATQVAPRPVNPQIGFDRIVEIAGRPGEGLAFGKPAKKLSRQVFAGQQVDVWSTEAGMMLVPVEKISVTPGAGANVDAGLVTAGAAASWVATNDQTIRETFGGNAFTVEEAKDKFGTVVLDDGTRLGDLLEGGQQNVTFTKPEELTTFIVDRQAAAISTQGRTLDAVVGTIGLQQGDTQLADVGIAQLQLLDDAQRGALSAAGIKTVGELAAADPVKVRTVFTDAGLSADAGSAARIVGISRGLGGLRFR